MLESLLCQPNYQSLPIDRRILNSALFPGRRSLEDVGIARTGGKPVSIPRTADIDEISSLRRFWPILNNDAGEVSGRMGALGQNIVDF